MTHPNFQTRAEALKLMNQWSKEKTPFLFIISYDQEKNLILPLDAINPDQIAYDFEGVTNQSPKNDLSKSYSFSGTPVSFSEFRKSFDLVKSGLLRGDSFLCNLTFETPVQTDLSLKSIFDLSQARFKLYLADQFLIFSPEIFVKIDKQQIIHSYPMKGTISADIPDAETIILRDEKESAEHATIVDLIRNDLSTVAFPVWVDRYRYIEHIETSNGPILQVSSEVCGQLDESAMQELGTIMFSMLPAGSITGAPKDSTCRIIAASETHDRNFYTGICGIFDGETLTSGVMIRYIEKRGEQMYFKSGGGITTKSEAESEYNELIKKVYVPIR
ncbi:MAG: aminodeoxychorismate synthase component I [Bacteroidales bacterium]